MGLSSACSILLLFSMVSLYHATMDICDEGYYCPVRANCSGNSTYCKEGICLAGDTKPIMDLTEERCVEEPIVLNFTQSSFSVPEGNGPAQPVLELTRALDCCTISVRVDIEDNTATAGDDFERLSGDYAEVIFPAGKTRATFDVIIEKDNLYERSETFRVTINAISVPYGVVLGSPRSAVVTILDDDAPTLRFEPEEYSVNEGDEVVDVSMSLSNPSAMELTFEVYSIDDTATECDYGIGTYGVVFPEGNTSASFRVNVSDDSVYEDDEIFKLAINRRMLGQVTVNGGNTAEVTIINDEEITFVGFEQRVYVVNEDDESISPVLKLDKPANCCINVRARLENMTALGRNVDFGYAPSRIYNYTFLAGETEASPDSNISIIDDLHFEDKENFKISIVDISLPYGYEMNENGSALICIMDNDNGIEFAERNVSVHEDSDDGFVTLTLLLNRPALVDITVQLITVSTSATEIADYEGGSFNVLIQKGEEMVTFNVNIINDKEEEEDEKFNVIITNQGLPDGITFKEGSELAEITIVNDDYDCRFDESTYIINEGDDLTLQLSLTRGIYKEVAILLGYFGTTDSDDFSHSGDKATFAVQDQQYQMIINTTIDTILESNETIDIIASLPEDRGNCRAQVIIVDDNECDFDQQLYEIEEGRATRIGLTFTKSLPEDVQIDLEYTTDTHLSLQKDFLRMPPRFVTLVGGRTVVSIPINTTADTILENNESLRIVAFPPSEDNRNCSTTVTILDDNNIRFDPSSYSVNESTETLDLTLTLDKALSDKLPVEVNWEYNRGTPGKRDIFFKSGETEITFEIKLDDDKTLEYDETFEVNAVPPAEPTGSRNAISTVTIKDDDTLTVQFSVGNFTIYDKNTVSGPFLMLSSDAAFDIPITLNQIDGTAKGGVIGDKMIDYEISQNYDFIFPAESTHNNELTFDIIDDDIVEPRNEYYLIKINSSLLPDGVSAGEIHTLQINIMDDDECMITLNRHDLHFSKGIYRNMDVEFRLIVGDPVPSTLIAGETSIQYAPIEYANIDEVVVYVPRILRGFVHKHHKIMIEWVDVDNMGR